MTRLRDSVDFFVAGTPAPQGSKRHVGGGRLVESSRFVKPWRAAIATVAKEQDALFDAPVSISALFILKRPQRPKWPVHGTRPDTDKLLRALLDGLTGPLLADDSLVYRIEATKRYALDGEDTGVHVNVTAW